MAEPLAINMHRKAERNIRPRNAGAPLMPAASSMSVRPMAINLPMLLQLKNATNCDSGNTITIKPAMLFIGSIRWWGISSGRRICLVTTP
ncbi:hypothetical protein D3C72_1610770 [compost metagenome]